MLYDVVTMDDDDERRRAISLSAASMLYTREKVNPLVVIRAAQIFEKYLRTGDSR